MPPGPSATRATSRGLERLFSPAGLAILFALAAADPKEQAKLPALRERRGLFVARLKRR